jgi:hypothetical protein
MTDEHQLEQAPAPEKDADDRDYEAPEVTALGKIGQLTNESVTSIHD